MATVVLDVEGILFKTRITTLTSVKGSFFEKIFSREWRSQLDKNGNLFIDRDSSIFPVILNFLRDGGTIPLPRDDYTLARILQEARFFHLFDLCDLVERTMSYAELPLKKPPKKSPQKFVKKEVHFEKEPVRQVPSLPPTPVPVLSELSRRLSADSTPIPIKKSTLEKKKKEKKPESISLPRNFAHVAHVGWNGRGVIFQKHLLGQEQTVRAIFDAASEADLTPVYNVVNGNDATYGSHSLEVILAGPHMNVKEQEQIKIEAKDLYTRPKKTPPKPPIKPDFPRPSSARN